MTKQKRKLTPREIASRQLLEEQARLDAVLDAARNLCREEGAPVRDATMLRICRNRLSEALDRYERGMK